MNTMGINLNNLNQTTFNASIKNKESNDVVEPETVNPENNVLTSPMETVGRSMVNFKSMKHLSSHDLNYIADTLANTNITSSELSVLKSSLVDTMKKYKAKNLTELMKIMDNSIDDTWQISCDIAESMQKKSPDIVFDRALTLVQHATSPYLR